MAKTKIVAILPAYNASKTLVPFLKNLPTDIFDEVILVDDSSADTTLQIAKRYQGIKTYQTLRNLGYGGNLKMCLGIALEHGADIMVELHPDGEYGFDGILPALEQIEKGTKFVLGNRFSDKKNGLKSGMYFWKYPFLRLLTWIDNLVLGTDIKDMHQGFRVYTKDFLQKVNFHANSNNYLFSFEIIAQATFSNITITSVPVTTFYRGKKRGVSLKSAISYSLGTVEVSILFILAKLGLKSKVFDKPKRVFSCPNCQLEFLVQYVLSNNKFSLYFCKICQNGFTYPMPKNMDSYYPKNYWNYQGMVGYLRKLVFNLFQKRRKKWLEKFLPRGGLILDIGSGEGNFGKSLSGKYKVVNLEVPFAKLENTQIIKADFLKWKTEKIFDAICFWESLEHTPKPQDYLNKAHSLLRKDGLIFIEYPRYQVWESKLFGKNWFHLDFPRHVVHLTDQGLNTLISRVGLMTKVHQSVFTYDYSPGGFFLSIANTQKFLNLLILSPLLILSLLIELILHILGQSPIGLFIAKKG